MDAPFNLENIRRMRGDVRAVLPAFGKGRIDNDTLSTCLAIAAEAGTYRILQSTSGLNAIKLMEEVSGTLSDALKAVMLKHLPEALVVQMFMAPK